MKKYTKEEIKNIIEEHRKWLNDEGGQRADLRSADLSYADLRSADLSYADLSYADLRSADLSYANLRYVKNLSFPIACPEEGSFVAWKKAKDKLIIKLLVLEDAKRSSSTGRKCRCDKAKVLEIQNLRGGKADVDFAESKYDESFIYKTGEIVTVTNFDENRWNECAPGIHFFITRKEAEDY